MAKITEAADTAVLSDIERSNTTQSSTNYETFPPGTVLLEDPNAETKHGRDGHVVLQPTPSRDPNDPLNVSNPLGEHSALSIVAALFSCTTPPFKLLDQRYCEAHEIKYSVGQLRRLF